MKKFLIFLIVFLVGCNRVNEKEKINIFNDFNYTGNGYIGEIETFDQKYEFIMFEPPVLDFFIDRDSTISAFLKINILINKEFDYNSIDSLKFILDNVNVSEDGNIILKDNTSVPYMDEDMINESNFLEIVINFDNVSSLENYLSSFNSENRITFSLLMTGSKQYNLQYYDLLSLQKTEVNVYSNPNLNIFLYNSSDREMVLNYEKSPQIEYSKHVIIEANNCSLPHEVVTNGRIVLKESEITYLFDTFENFEKKLNDTMSIEVKIKMFNIKDELVEEYNTYIKHIQ